jgi:hypothetical protein
MTSIKKNKNYRVITLLWPNVDRMVADAEKMLDDLTIPGHDMPFVSECALMAAKSAITVEYTDDFTHRKLMAFCESFKECLLDLEKMKIKTRVGEWSPCDGPLKNNVKNGNGYTVGMRKIPVENKAYREMVSCWINNHV